MARQLTIHSYVIGDRSRLLQSLFTHLSRTPIMSDREQLELIRRLTLAQLAQLRAEPKPTYSIDGQTISWTAYIRSLHDTIDWCDAKLIGLEPFEIRSQAFT
jgi:hypothetical protein